MVAIAIAKCGHGCASAVALMVVCVVLLVVGLVPTAHATQVADAPPTPPLPLNTTAWNEDLARRYLYHAYAAYCPTAVLQSWKCKFCRGTVTFLDTVYDSKTNTFVFLAYDSANNEIVISYRGTQPTSLKNWIEDLKFWKADTEFDGLAGAKVAKGFFECFKVLSAGVIRIVRNALQAHPTASVIVTGHSLGGAMATLAALDLKVVVGIVPRELFTFGSPRVGNTGFYHQFAGQMTATPHWRVVNDRDIVPHLPPFSFDFHHTTTEVWEHKAQYKVCDQTGEDKSCAWSVILPILPDSIIDHLNYMQLSGGLCLGLNDEVISDAEPTLTRNLMPQEPEAELEPAASASASSSPSALPLLLHRLVHPQVLQS